MLKLKSNDIKDFPFEQYAKLNDSQLEDLAKTHFLTAHNSWMLPQIGAHYGRWDLRLSGHKIDPNATAKANIKTDWDMGLWRVVTKLKRGSLVKSQVNPEFASYSALVPIILMGVKRFQGVNYSDWDIHHTSPLVEKNLLEAMCWIPEGDGVLQANMANFGLTKERLLEIRKQGLTPKSGSKVGIINKPTSQWCLRGIKDTELGAIPKLVTTMLTQIWVAHPSLRTEYMILDPQAWDLMPEPLLSTDVFTKRESYPGYDNLGSKDISSDLPWEV